MVDPVTFKVFTDNTHIVALKNTGNVFAYDTVERLNIKAKMWRDLINEEEFTRKDIITLQDPQNLASRDLSSFKYLQDGISTLTEEQQRGRGATVNSQALGSNAKVLRAKEAVAAARIQRDPSNPNHNPALASYTTLSFPKNRTPISGPMHTAKTVPYNAAQHTTGKAAASFTSTGLTPHTSAERALLTDEEYMLRARRVKIKGYARITTSLGDLTVELTPEFAPRAVWNFTQLAKKGYYNGVIFHRNIRNFMIQGGDPTGTGRGGQSIWGKNFQDEFDGPASHDARGIVSMANKGKNTNSSQFFIIYRPAKHLDRKHTIFGKVVGGLDILSRLENVEVNDGDKRPIEDIVIKEIAVFVDPFEEFQKKKRETDELEREKEETVKNGGTEDDKTTWTGRKVGIGKIADHSQEKGVGKYLKARINGLGGVSPKDVQVNTDDLEQGFIEEPAKKKVKLGGGFGSFDNW